jgi:hypothetical protein
MAFCCSADPLAVRQVMEEEVTTRVGPKGRHDADRVATCNGAAARSAPTRRCPQAALLARALQYTKTGIPDRSTSNGRQPPRARNALEFVFAPVLELDARPGHKIHDRS